MKLFDLVSLKEDVPNEGPRKGTVGTVVALFDTPEAAYDVEFTNERGETLCEIVFAVPSCPESEWIMPTSTIALEVDADTARAFSTASPEDRRKLQLLLGLRLRELTARPARPLKEVMDDIGQHAEVCGLTPEILESLLHDE